MPKLLSNSLNTVSKRSHVGRSGKWVKGMLTTGLFLALVALIYGLAGATKPSDVADNGLIETNTALSALPQLKINAHRPKPPAEVASATVAEPEPATDAASSFKDQIEQAGNAYDLMHIYTDDDTDDLDASKDDEVFDKKSTVTLKPMPENDDRLEGQFLTRKHFQEALGASTRLSFNSGKNLPFSTAGDGVNESYSASRRIGPVGSGVKDEGFTNLNEYNTLRNGNYELNHEVQSLKSPYLIRQGSIIPAVLLSGINSELPGQVSAQVTEDVYDSPLGNYLLIPRGTMIVGQYGSNSRYKQRRLFIAFNRLLFPDGSSLDLGNMPGASPDGYAGFDATTETHFFEGFFGSSMVSAVNTASQVAQSKTHQSEGADWGSSDAENFGNSATSETYKLVERNLNLAPNLNVKPGYQFIITVSKDMIFNRVFA